MCVCVFIEVSADGFYVIRDFPVSLRGFESFTRRFSNSVNESIDGAQFSQNSDSRDVSRITVSTLPLTTKYPKLPDVTEKKTTQLLWLLTKFPPKFSISQREAYPFLLKLG